MLNHIDFTSLGADLLSRADTLVPAWLPGGKRRGHEWVCGDLAGSEGDSCSVNLTTGAWADFAGELRGGDLTSLYAAIHGCSQLEAAKQLSPEPVRPVPRAASSPAPAADPERAFAHSGFGVPTAWWAYHDAQGQITGYICRYDPPGGKKQIVPWRWIEGRWQAKGWPKPRPLYRLHCIKPGERILIVEGEKAAEAAQRLLPSYVVTTWQGGASAVGTADLAPLAGMPVLLWADADDPGTKAMATLGAALHAQGCAVRIVTPTDAIDGWDLADAEQAGWDTARVVAWAKSRTEVFEPPAPPPPRRVAPVLGVVDGNVIRAPAPSMKPLSATSMEITDSDIANAKRMHARHGRNLKFTVHRGWFVWDGKRWKADEKAVIVQALAKETVLAMFDEIKYSPDRDLLYKHARKSQSKGSIEAMMWLLRSEENILEGLTSFDHNKWLLNVANGTVDLQTGDLLPHSQEDLISNITEVHFDPTASCELWDEFIMTVTDKNEDLYNYIRRFVGYLLVGDTSDQSLHFLHGMGANGKSVFCDVITRLLGDYAIIVSPDMLMSKRAGAIPNDVARLRGVRAAFANETSQGARFDEAKLKDLTGGDKLSARFLREEFFDFPPTHRIVIRGNHKPTINGTDEGIWRRLRLVPFAVHIPHEMRDAHLAEKLTEELPGILQWALVGLREWQAFGNLRPPAAVLQAVEEYRAESDTLGRFIEESCEVSALYEVKSKSFFTAYQEFCRTGGERWARSQDLPHEMERRGYQQRKRHFGMVYEGIRLSATEEFSGKNYNDY